MPALTCYRLHETLRGSVPENLDEYIDIEDQAPVIYGPVNHADFVAKLYVSVGAPHPPNWAGFVRGGFETTQDRGREEAGEAVEGPLLLPMTSSVGAAVVLKLVPKDVCSLIRLESRGDSF